MRRMQKDAMSEAIWLVSGLTKRHALTPGHLPLLSKEPAVIRTCRQGMSKMMFQSVLEGCEEMSADLLLRGHSEETLRGHSEENPECICFRGEEEGGSDDEEP